jgi:peptide deformylase
MRISYQSSVYTKAGWRSVVIEAVAQKVSEGMAVVEKVLRINGQEPKANMSRTGATRQQYYGLGVAAKEIGKRKRISACKIEEA